MSQFEQKLHRDLPPTTVWGYDGSYPGPSFEARTGVPVFVKWIDDLPTRHLFNVDTKIHGAEYPENPYVRNVVHLHGSHTPSASDGLPMDWFTPGRSKTAWYPNSQQATTLWYHDHAMGVGRLNIYAGLAGFLFPARCGRSTAQPAERPLRDPAHDPGPLVHARRPALLFEVVDARVLRERRARQRQGVAAPDGRAAQVPLPLPERLERPLLRPEAVRERRERPAAQGLGPAGAGPGLLPDRERRRIPAGSGEAQRSFRPPFAAAPAGRGRAPTWSSISPPTRAGTS